MNRDNKVLYGKVSSITTRDPEPSSLNQNFISQEARNKLITDKLRKMQSQQLKAQNDFLQERIKNQTAAFFSARKLDTMYNSEHGKMVEKMKKIKSSSPSRYEVLNTLTHASSMSTRKNTSLNFSSKNSLPPIDLKKHHSSALSTDVSPYKMIMTDASKFVSLQHI
jgi:hypothetical protein